MSGGFRVFAGRLWRRRRRGAALLDTMLALAVLGVVAMGAVLWLDSRRQKDVMAEAGRQVAILGDAALHYARTHFADAAFAPGAHRLSFGDLESGGILPTGFAGSDAMRRELRVWYRREGPAPLYDRVLVLAGQSRFRAGGDTRMPYRALFASRGKVRLGMVRSGSVCMAAGLTAPCLVGPTVARSLTAPFDAGWIEEGAIMALVEVTREEFCGDLVLRQAHSTCPGSALLGSLDMGAHAVRNVGELTVGAAGASGYTHEVAVTNDIQVSGDMRVDIVSGRGGLVVDRTVEVGSTMTVSGGLSIYGNVEVRNDLDIRDDFRVHGNLDVSGGVDADNVRAQTMDVQETAEENLNVGILRVDSCPACTQ